MNEREVRLWIWRIINILCSLSGHRLFDRCRPGYPDSQGSWDLWVTESEIARAFRVEFERRWGSKNG